MFLLIMFLKCFFKILLAPIHNRMSSLAYEPKHIYARQKCIDSSFVDLQIMLNFKKHVKIYKAH